MSGEEDKIRTTIVIDKQLYYKFKSKVALHGKRIKDVLAELIKKYLEES